MTAPPRVRLTPAQVAFLESVANAGRWGQTFHDGYKPGLRLVELGLIAKHVRGGYLHVATSEGLAWLAQREEQ